MRISQRAIQLRLPDALHGKLGQLAARDASTLSATMRRLLAIAVARELENR